MKHSQIHHSGRQEKKKMHFILILKHAGSNVIALFKKTLCDRKTASCKQNAHIMYYIQKLTVRAEWPPDTFIGK